MAFCADFDSSSVFYTYDGSFDGLLTAIHTAVYSRKVPGGIAPLDGMQFTLGARYEDIVTNKNLAKRVYDAISRKIGPFGMKRLYYVFLSDDKDKDLIIYKYMMLGFKNGSTTNSALTNDTVIKALKLAENVSRETERFRQFTRFSVMSTGVQYAKIAPKNCILPVLMPFFVKRLQNVPFVLHDLTHNICAIYDTSSWYVTSSAGLTAPDSDSKEDDIKKLWNTFFDAISIKERENTHLQKQNMPARYFKSQWSLQR